MLSQHFYVATYWGARPEPAEACASRIYALLQEFTGCDESLGTWYSVRARESNGDLRRADSPAVVQHLVEAGRSYTDEPRHVVKELGYQVALRNSASGNRGLSLNVVVGSFPPPESELTNLCLLSYDLATEGEQTSILAEGLAEHVLTVMARCMDAEWGVFCSHELFEAARLTIEGPYCGWSTYLDASLFSDTALFELFPMVRTLPNGALLSLGLHHERADLTTAAELARASTVSLRALLDRGRAG